MPRTMKAEKATPAAAEATPENIPAVTPATGAASGIADLRAAACKAGGGRQARLCRRPARENQRQPERRSRRPGHAPAAEATAITRCRSGSTASSPTRNT